MFYAFPDFNIISGQRNDDVDDCDGGHYTFSIFQFQFFQNLLHKRVRSAMYKGN